MAGQQLTERQKIVLQLAQFLYHEGPEKIAKVSGIPVHQVRYDLKTLRERNLLFIRRHINESSLGYYLFHMHLSVRSQDAPRLLKALSESSRVLYLSRNGGERAVGVTILSRRPEHIFAVMDGAAAKSRVRFSQVGWSVETIFYHFGATLSNKRTNFKGEVIQTWSGDPVGIDRVDARILKLVKTGVALSASDISRALGIPESTARYRVKRLEDEGVFLPRSAFVNLALLGFTEFEVLVHMSHMSQSDHVRFIDFCRRHPAITILIRCFGDWQYKFAASVEQPREIFELEEEISRTFADFVESVTIVSRREEVKSSDFPIEDFE